MTQLLQSMHDEKYLYNTYTHKLYMKETEIIDLNKEINDHTRLLSLIGGMIAIFVASMILGLPGRLLDAKNMQIDELAMLVLYTFLALITLTMVVYLIKVVYDEKKFDKSKLQEQLVDYRAIWQTINDMDTVKATSDDVLNVDLDKIGKKYGINVYDKYDIY